MKLDTYLQTKFKGKYRIRAELDLVTHDFIRDENGNIESSFADFYIKCRNGDSIRHWGKNILEYYCTSLGRLHNLVRAIYEQELGEEPPKKLQKVVDRLLAEKIITHYGESDIEGVFRFKTENMEKFEELLKPETRGASISPFSPKNLPKDTYVIPDEDNELYRQSIGVVTFGDGSARKISMLNKEFVELIEKREKIDFTADCLMNKLHFKQYIHKKGWWQEYCEFLKERMIEC